MSKAAELAKFIGDGVAVVQVTKVKDFQDTNLAASRLQSASTSYVASALEARITPKFADSHINVRFASSIKYKSRLCSFSGLYNL